ncbi:MAG: Nif3-like dinuclear metal center hexameric protein [Nocardioides sp.]
MPQLAEVLDLFHGWYPPATAAGWDAVGLVVGDPAGDVRRIALAVDITAATAGEAAEWGADLLVTHHPLFLRGVHAVAADTGKGSTLATLTAAGCALLCAHTNADVAIGGVSEALADAVGLSDARPLVPSLWQLDKITTYVPNHAAERVRRALADAGAGRIGAYDGASFSSTGEGRFRPLAGAEPAIGSVGTPEVVPETRIEAVLGRELRARVVDALLAAHPYEEPAYDLVELAETGRGRTGLGRVGDVVETTLAGFAARVSEALPATARGVLVGGDPDRVVRRVATAPGAGDDHLDAARASGADVYLTSDLRHHPAIEFLEQDGPALVDVSHWAAEWTWLPVVEARLRSALGDTVETRVSTRCTDAWTIRS